MPNGEKKMCNHVWTVSAGVLQDAPKFWHEDRNGVCRVWKPDTSDD